jgi:hypothetical protein
VSLGGFRISERELERTETLLQSSFCNHLYRHTEIIENNFFLHIVCLCVCMLYMFLCISRLNA